MVMSRQDILIFDLDGTIDRHVMTPDKLKFVQNLMDEHSKNNGKLYVITARRLNEFKSQKELLEYNIPKSLVQRLIDENRRRSGWLFYNNNMNHAVTNADKLLQAHDKVHLFKEFVDKHGLEQMNFILGIQKMIQIEQLLEKYTGNSVSICFFDDARPNWYAWRFYCEFINPNFENIQFYGGDDGPVF